MVDNLAEVIAVYEGSNGDATRALYRLLEALGPAGVVAMNLFRACKASERAKLYRPGPGHVGAAYEKKDWSIGNACAALHHGYAPGIAWGWSVDETLKAQDSPHHHVLYVDLPTGQISFHTGARGPGPDYPGAWDGVRGVSKGRVCRWCATLLGFETPAEPVTPDPAPTVAARRRPRPRPKTAPAGRLPPGRDLFR